MALRYEVVTRKRAGMKRRHEYVPKDALSPGDIIVLEGRNWLVEQVERGAGHMPEVVFVKPARYRLRLLHPDGREEV